jgi:hypothetical protein
MDKIIKIVLAILLLLCLADMPYGYYQLVRFIATVGFAVLAYFAYTEKNKIEMIVCIALAILFQPLAKIALGREIWNVVDVVAAVGLIVSIFVKTKNSMTSHIKIIFRIFVLSKKEI